MTPVTCKIWWDQQVGAYRVMTPFRKELVEFIKSQIPISERAWDPNSKIWTIAERWLEPTKDLVKAAFGGTPVIVTRAQAEQAQTSPAVAKAKIEDVIVQFVRLVGEAAMQKAYREAAMANHPDRGGSMETMTKINELWNKIRAEMYNGTAKNNI